MDDEISTDVNELAARAWSLRKTYPEQAEALFKQALELDPAHTDSLRYYGVFLSQSEQYGPAIRVLKRCLAYAPCDAVAWCDLGAAYSRMGLYSESIDALNRALQIAPNMPAARFNRATPLLAMGNWAQGWQDYEYGKACGVRVGRFLQSEWTGWSSLEGHTIYIWGEQGFGDQIMAVQLIPILRERFHPSKVILEVRPELVALLANLPFIDEIIAAPSDQHEPHPFDVHVSLMSLPAALNLTPSDLPGAVNYITANPAPTKARIGICLQGSTQHYDDKNRSIPRDLWESTAGATLKDTIYIGGKDWEGTDWTRTASLIAGLDLVITVDTAIAHLAGAMGKPTRILLPKLCDFRWGTTAPTTPWYPSARLYRQTNQTNWPSAIDLVIRECN